MSDTTRAPLLSIRDLAVQYRTRSGPVDAVRGVSFDVEAGAVTALVGESGSGKTTVAQSVIGLLASNGHVSSGSIRLNERTDGLTDLVGLPERRWRHLRGRCIALIPQDPGNSLNPVATIGWSVGESLRIHGWKNSAKVQARVIDLLERVGIDDPEARARQYPHELSGGMRQRVLIAAALALEPELIIADEPTSALDVTVQRTVLDLLDDLRAESGTGILFITHNLGVVAEIADRVAVMYAGRVVEIGPVDEVLDAPRHPYTLGLLNSSAANVAPGERLNQIDGVAPRIDARPSGCPFRPRCPRVQPVCAERDPEAAGEGARSFRCHNPVPVGEAA